jgi:hypothetical protein
VRFAINLEWNGVSTLYVVRISPEARELFTAGNAVCTLGAWNMLRVSLTTSQILAGIMQVYVHIVWTETECLTQVTLPLLNLRVMGECHDISDICIAVLWAG